MIHNDKLSKPPGDNNTLQITYSTVIHKHTTRTICVKKKNHILPPSTI